MPEELLSNQKKKSFWKYGISAHESILNGEYHQSVLSNDTMGDILRFYVLNTPCQGLSYQTRPFSSYGWEGDVRYNGLGKALDDALDAKHGQFLFPKYPNRGYKVSTNDTVCANLDYLFRITSLTDGIVQDPLIERGASCATNESNTWLRVFRHIRNCLAHGRFKAVTSGNSTEPILIMEDRDKSNITARIVIKAKTLVAWKRIIENGPSNNNLS